MGPIDTAISLIELNVPTIVANYPYIGDHYFNLICSYVKERDLRVAPMSATDFREVEKAVG